MIWYCVTYRVGREIRQQCFRAESLKDARKRGSEIAKLNGGTEASTRKW